MKAVVAAAVWNGLSVSLLPPGKKKPVAVFGGWIDFPLPLRREGGRKAERAEGGERVGSPSEAQQPFSP